MAHDALSKKKHLEPSDYELMDAWSGIIAMVVSIVVSDISLVPLSHNAIATGK